MPSNVNNSYKSTQHTETPPRSRSSSRRERDWRPASSCSQTSNQPARPQSSNSNPEHPSTLREPTSTAWPYALCRQASSGTHGQGMFASQQLERGELILRETPLAIWPADLCPSNESIWQKYLSLSKAERQSWYQLHHIPKAECEPRFNDDPPTKGLPTERKLRAEVLSKYEDNSFGDALDSSFLCIKAVSTLSPEQYDIRYIC